MYSMFNQPVVAFFSPGPWEIAIIGIVAVLLFGNRLPGVARSVGSSFIEFKRGLSGIEKEVDDLQNTVKQNADDINKATTTKS